MPDLLSAPFEEPHADPDEARRAETQAIADPGFEPETGERRYARMHEDGRVLTGTAQEVGKLCTGMAGLEQEKIVSVLETHRIGQEARARDGGENRSMDDRVERMKRAAERAKLSAVEKKPAPKVTDEAPPEPQPREKPIPEVVAPADTVVPEVITPEVVVANPIVQKVELPEPVVVPEPTPEPEQRRIAPDTVDSLPVVEHAIWMARSTETAEEETPEITPETRPRAEVAINAETATVEPKPTVRPLPSIEHSAPQPEITEAIVSTKLPEAAEPHADLPEAPLLPPPIELTPTLADIAWEIPSALTVEDVLDDLGLDTIDNEGKEPRPSLTTLELDMAAMEPAEEEIPAPTVSAEHIDRPQTEFETTMQTLTERVAELEPAEAAEVHVLLGELRTIIETIQELPAGESAKADVAIEEQLRETLTELFEYSGIECSPEAIERLVRALIASPETTSPRPLPTAEPDLNFAERSLLLGTNEGLHQVLAAIQQLRWQTSRTHRYLGKLGVVTSLFKPLEMSRLAAA